MTVPTFVVQEEPTGRWVAGCCDEWHYFPWTQDYETEKEAEAGLRGHRLAESQEKIRAAEEKMRQDRAYVAKRCPGCGYLLLTP